MRLSLRWKLILSIVGPLVVLTILVMWFTVNSLYEFSIERVRDLTLQRARDDASQLDASFRIVAQVAHANAALMEKTTAPERKFMREILEAAVASNSLVHGAAIRFNNTSSGTGDDPFNAYVFLDEGELHFLEGDRLGEDWLSQKYENNSPGWSEPYHETAANDRLIERYTVPFSREDVFQGIVAVDVALDVLQSQVMREYLGDRLFIILSPSGRYIAHPDRDKVMDETLRNQARMSGDPGLIKLAEDMVRGNSGVIRVKNLTSGVNGPYWIAYTPIRSAGWSFAAATPEEELLAFANKQIGRGVIGVLILIALVIICILWVGTHITRPITELAAVVSEVGQGNFHVKVTGTQAQDEVGDLARAFNEMVRQLNRHIHALTTEIASREAYESEMRVAREMQSALLPSALHPFPEHHEFELSAVNAAARHVAGDFFDYFFVGEDDLVLIIADVSGKGTPAAIVMAVTRTIIRNLAKSGASPSELLTETNRLLLQTDISPVFVTMFVAVYHPSNGRITYANAGHQPPYLLCNNSTLSKFGQATGTIVGMLDDAEYDECEAELLAGEALIVYTDGIPDARSPDGVFYGEAHFTSLLASCTGMNAAEICDIAISEITAFQAKSLADDITLLVLKRNH
ncbi:MAG TPA: SpoIIE family protein phosphatase [Gammaproteobacteria bacterium]|nr:SpoIIE family protein phosphatase [Gammaproteobacteria bacterium]